LVVLSFGLGEEDMGLALSWDGGDGIS